MRKSWREHSIYDFSDKRGNAYNYIDSMLIRSQDMFRWSGLPETIPEDMLEIYLQTNGNTCITEVAGKLYAFCGGLGGEPDAYYRPTIYTVANPALNYNAQLVIDKDCILIKNDPLIMGFLPAFERYAAQLVEDDVSLRLAAILARIPKVLTADNDSTRASAEKFLLDILDGKLGIVTTDAFLKGLDGVDVLGSGAKQSITDLIELRNYNLASWYRYIGLNANDNMKRESIGVGESALDDHLQPLPAIMLKMRQEGAEKVNRMYGTNISVELNGVWLEREAVPDQDPEEEVEDSERVSEETE